LYVHGHRRGVQAWMYCSTAREGEGTRNGNWNENGESEQGDSLRRGKGASEREWRRTYEGQEHPDLDGYVLHFLESGAPRWVRNVSAKAYEKAQRKRMAMA
ncbi:hypothetical protein OH76DRAFT_1303638, partial [Lentinus brumalis]